MVNVLENYKTAIRLEVVLFILTWGLMALIAQPPLYIFCRWYYNQSEVIPLIMIIILDVVIISGIIYFYKHTWWQQYKFKIVIHATGCIIAIVASVVYNYDEEMFLARLRANDRAMAVWSEYKHLEQCQAVVKEFKELTTLLMERHAEREQYRINSVLGRF